MRTRSSVRNGTKDTTERTPRYRLRSSKNPKEEVSERGEEKIGSKTENSLREGVVERKDAEYAFRSKRFSREMIVERDSEKDNSIQEESHEDDDDVDIKLSAPTPKRRSKRRMFLINSPEKSPEHSPEHSPENPPERSPEKSPRNSDIELPDRKTQEGDDEIGDNGTSEESQPPIRRAKRRRRKSVIVIDDDDSEAGNAGDSSKDESFGEEEQEDIKSVLCVRSETPRASQSSKNFRTLRTPSKRKQKEDEKYFAALAAYKKKRKEKGGISQESEEEEEEYVPEYKERRKSTRSARNRRSNGSTRSRGQRPLDLKRSVIVVSEDSDGVDQKVVEDSMEEENGENTDKESYDHSLPKGVEITQDESSEESEEMSGMETGAARVEMREFLRNILGRFDRYSPVRLNRGVVKAKDIEESWIVEGLGFCGIWAGLPYNLRELISEYVAEEVKRTPLLLCLRKAINRRDFKRALSILPDRVKTRKRELKLSNIIGSEEAYNSVTKACNSVGISVNIILYALISMLKARQFGISWAREALSRYIPFDTYQSKSLWWAVCTGKIEIKRRDQEHAVDEMCHFQEMRDNFYSRHQEVYRTYTKPVPRHVFLGIAFSDFSQLTNFEHYHSTRKKVSKLVTGFTSKVKEVYKTNPEECKPLLKATSVLICGMCQKYPRMITHLAEIPKYDKTSPQDHNDIPQRGKFHSQEENSGIRGDSSSEESAKISRRARNPVIAGDSSSEESAKIHDEENPGIGRHSLSEEPRENPGRRRLRRLVRNPGIRGDSSSEESIRIQGEVERPEENKQQSEDADITIVDSKSQQDNEESPEESKVLDINEDGQINIQEAEPKEYVRIGRCCQYKLRLSKDIVEFLRELFHYRLLLYLDEDLSDAFYTIVAVVLLFYEDLARDTKLAF
ncbi:hypothetical protein AAMO2058_000885700 [Amorphochlora amoebiformis]